MRPYFAVNLDLAGRPCLIIGGDACALEKARALVEAKAVLTLVSRKLLPELEIYAIEAGIRVLKRDWQPEDLQGQLLCMNCVETDRALSKQIHAQARQLKCLLWSHDQAAESDVALPAVLKSGSLRITVSSGGLAPGISSALRKELEALLDSQFQEFFENYAARRRCMLDSDGFAQQRREGLVKSLLGLAIMGDLEYPTVWRENRRFGVEFRDGLWLRNNANENKF